MTDGMVSTGPARHLPQRAWRVEASPETGSLHCTVPSCPGPSSGGAVRTTALAHLATHARSEPLASHLRTCRCRAHGCSWHPRHRGCDGPVRLILVRLERGRVWQLADMCTGCAHALSDAAVVPDQTAIDLEDRNTAHRAPTRSTPRPPAQDGSDPLAAVLRYLAVALPPDVRPAAVLLALLCLLRAAEDGTAQLTEGLMRSWRLAHEADTLLPELVGAHWLRPGPVSLGHLKDLPGGGWSVMVTDLAAGAAGISRRERSRLLDRVSRLLTRPALRAADAATRLADLHQHAGVRSAASRMQRVGTAPD